ncbi:MAG: hypothetical protein Q8Q84_27375 [Hydrogenophaga sp.]|nr:hypothetical protein [Hydrogenophaga sp.]
MIWWRGSGLWIGLFAFLPAFGAIKLGAMNVAIAYAASAVLVYLLRDWFEPESALFSIPTRYWPPLLLLISLIVQFSPSKSPPVSNLQTAIAESQASLPRMLGKQIQVDRTDYENGMLHYYATSTVSFDKSDPQQAAFDRQVREHYCEQAKMLWQSNVGIAINLAVPPRTLNERVRKHSLALRPEECQSRSS